MASSFVYGIGIGGFALFNLGIIALEFRIWVYFGINKLLFIFLILFLDESDV